MTAFEDLGRMVLEITIANRLGENAKRYDIPTLVDAYVARFGFRDIDEVNAFELAELAARYRLN